MSTYAFTPASTYGTTRGGGATTLAAEAPMSATGAQAQTEAALNSGWNSVGWHNPFFWLVALVLVWLGYIFFGFNVGVKGVGKVSVDAH